MKFDIWTFLFQVINFIVLLLILKRLLYKPIREIMEKRKGIVEKTIQEANEAKKEAVELKGKYQEELNKLEEIKTEAMEKMRTEVEVERKELTAKAEKEAEEIIEKEKAIFDTEKRRLETELKDRAIETVSVLALNLLRDVSDEDLHKSIWMKLFKEIGKIASDIANMKIRDDEITISIITSYPIQDTELRQFQEMMESRISKKVNVNTIIDNTLVAGVRIKAYDMVYDFSLSGQIDDVKFRLKESV
jgi:F-type H+-transporting ATPase subunit b